MDVSECNLVLLMNSEANLLYQETNKTSTQPRMTQETKIEEKNTSGLYVNSVFLNQSVSFQIGHRQSDSAHLLTLQSFHLAHSQVWLIYVWKETDSRKRIATVQYIDGGTNVDLIRIDLIVFLVNWHTEKDCSYRTEHMSEVTMSRCYKSSCTGGCWCGGNRKRYSEGACASYCARLCRK